LKGSRNTPFFYTLIFILTQFNISYMKDIYKQTVDNTIEMMEQRVKIVNQMITGERPADPKQAEIYLRETLKGLEKVREIVVRG